MNEGPLVAAVVSSVLLLKEACSVPTAAENSEEVGKVFEATGPS